MHIPGLSRLKRKHFWAPISHKVETSLIAHVYAQTPVALVASLVCATIIFISFSFTAKSFFHPLVWFGVFLAVTLIRSTVIYAYKHILLTDRNFKLWRNLYIVGSILGGVSWGLGAFMLLTQSTALEQTLLLLMLAGVTAGVVPLAAGIPAAAMGFLLASIPAYIVIIASFDNYVYMMFDIVLTLYLFYLSAVTLKTHQLIRNSIILKFENDELLRDLTLAKTQLENINVKLQQSATHDPLTQLANRVLFRTAFEEAIKRSSAQKNMLGLLFMDLDHFKPINDNYGHHAGDKVLIVVAERLTGLFGMNDHVARLGGDEFAVIVENITNYQQLETIAANICRTISAPIALTDRIVHISASIGISVCPNDAYDVDTLQALADQSMYAAKKQGGNYYKINRHVAEKAVC